MKYKQEAREFLKRKILLKKENIYFNCVERRRSRHGQGKKSEAVICLEQGELIHLKLENITNISLYIGGMLKDEHYLML